MNNYLYLIGDDTDFVFQRNRNFNLDPEAGKILYSKLTLFHSEREAPWPMQYFVDMIHTYDKEGEPRLAWKDLESNPEYLGQLLIMKKDLELTKRKISQLVAVPNRAILESTHEEPAIKQLCKYILTHTNIEFLFSYLKPPKEDDAA